MGPLLRASRPATSSKRRRCSARDIEHASSLHFTRARHGVESTLHARKQERVRASTVDVVQRTGGLRLLGQETRKVDADDGADREARVDDALPLT